MSRPAFTLGTAKITNVEPLETSKSRWLGLNLISWEDEEGRQRKWESAARKTRSDDTGVDAVAVLALLHHPERPLSTVVVTQYRPPVDAVCVELPAGLVDAGESLESTAVRELYEETGYGRGPDGGAAEVISVSPSIVSDPGMSSANMSLVTVKVTLRADAAAPPQAQNEPGEHIVVEVVPLVELHDRLVEWGKRDRWSVDARLMHLAWGYKLAAQTG